MFEAKSKCVSMEKLELFTAVDLFGKQLTQGNCINLSPEVTESLN
jgi:hypothetical protein